MFSLERGTGFDQIIDILYANKLIKSKFFFYLYCIINGYQDSFKSGHYTIQSGITRKELVRELQRGRAKQYKITIYEGMTIKEIARSLHRNTPFNEKIFLELAYKHGREFKY